MTRSGPAANPTRLLEVRNVVHEFVVRGAGGVKGGVVHAVSDVSFDLDAGETLGVVGETGSGKSTLARCVLQAPRPKAGSVRFQGTELVGLRGRRLQRARRDMQMVFQDPFGSLNPRWRIADIVEEPLIGFGDGNAGRPTHGACVTCSTWWVSTPTSMAGGTRASCPAASASGWRSRGRSRCTRRSSCATSRCPRSTC